MAGAVVWLLLVSCPGIGGRVPESGIRDPDRFRVAVFPFSNEPGFAADVARALEPVSRFIRLDRSLVAAAVAGAGYTGSLNLTREEARRLGSVVGADALVLGTASFLDRGAGAGDAFVGLFLVDGRSGDLLRYKGVSVAAETVLAARSRALEAVRAEMSGWIDLCEAAATRRERIEAEQADPKGLVDLVARESWPGVSPPRFFKKPSPAMTPDGERALVTATVDVVVQFNSDGSYGPITIARWAGFGLDEAVVEAVRKSTFFPAMRDRKPVPARALLRYNFRVKTDPVGASRGPKETIASGVIHVLG
jgi:hypothetical protein